MTVESISQTHEAPLNTGELSTINAIERDASRDTLNTQLADFLEDMDRTVPNSLENAESKVEAVKKLSDGFASDTRRTEQLSPDLVEEVHDKAHQGLSLWRLGADEIADYARLSQLRSVKELNPMQKKRAEYVHGGEFANPKELLEFVRLDASLRLRLDESIVTKQAMETQNVPAVKTQPETVTSAAAAYSNEQILPDDIAERQVMELNGQLVEVRTTKNGQEWFYAMNEAGKLHRIGRARVDALAGIQAAQKEPTPSSAESRPMPSAENPVGLDPARLERAVRAAQRLETVFPSTPGTEEAPAGENTQEAPAATASLTEQADASEKRELTPMQRRAVAALRLGRKAMGAVKGKAYYAHTAGTQSVQEFIQKQAEKRQNQEPATEKRNRILGRIVVAGAVGVAAYAAMRGLESLSHAMNDLQGSGAGEAAGGIDLGHVPGHDVIAPITAPEAAAATPVTPDVTVVPGTSGGGAGIDGSTAANLDPASMAQEGIGTLSKGQHLWGESTDLLKYVGIDNPSDAQISTVTNWMLKANNLSFEDARHLPVGYQPVMPSIAELEDLLKVKISQ